MNERNAVRVVRETTMRLSAPPERVFPLLCPVREHDWIDAWKARIVHTESGLAEKGCVFTTAEAHGGESVWAVTRYEPQAGVIEFVVVTPGLVVTTLEITLHREGPATRAEWRRTFTALSAAGERAVAQLAGPAFDERMRRLERQLDHFLASGEMLRS